MAHPPRSTGPDTGPADRLLARAMQEVTPWPEDVSPELAAERALYHGIAGCLTGSLPSWPSSVSEPLRRTATAQAMWELRHRQVLGALLEALHHAGVRALVLKGSALAYDLYDPPASRARGDSDILVAPADVEAARSVLSGQGFAHYYDAPGADEDVRLQETWRKRTPEGRLHDIDLHWQALNAPALARLLPFEEALRQAIPLPRIGPHAFGLSRPMALLLACAHRAQHIVIPYFVDGTIHYADDRLIWLRDIDLLAQALSPAEWEAVVGLSAAGGLSAVVLEGLQMAARRLGTPLPADVADRIAGSPQDTRPARYLLSSRQAGRAWHDLRAAQGLRGKAVFLWGRLLPPAAFMRGRYPQRDREPLALLYLRRVLEFLRPRPGGGRP